jgi:hypothetical protein
MTQQRKPRKPNSNKGLTKPQQAAANKQLSEVIRSFNQEREAGTLGKAGSMWEIAADGTAKYLGPSRADVLAALSFGSDVMTRH